MKDRNNLSRNEKKRVPAQKVANSSSLRRSSRVAIDMPVEVFGQTAGGKVFREETCTLVVSAHGALLTITSIKEIKSAILLINKKTSIEVQCRVVFQKQTDADRAELGVEFVTPQPRFWGIAFPPEDWNNADRKRPPSLSK